jgi:hypothetical protein
MTAVQRPSLFRRAAVLLLLTVGLVLGAALPSWASFTDAVALPQLTVSTQNVAVQGAVKATATCVGGTATVTMKWTASDAPGVTGYRVRQYLNGGAWQDVATVTDTTYTGDMDDSYVINNTMSMSVWTLTQYGWTAESGRTGRIKCS